MRHLSHCKAAASLESAKFNATTSFERVHTGKSSASASGKKKPAFRRLFHFGTEGGTRTHTLLRASDFESDASTNSTTPAQQGEV
jgi:hypothetical protein